MIKRTLYESLQAHLDQKQISLITGPRQAGKTTLMLLLQQELEKNGERTIFLNLDIEKDRQFFVSQEDLLDKIRLDLGERGYVFIDEIQRKENAGIFLKGIYDMGLPFKFIVSGSGSVELKEKIPESLVGRKQTFALNPLSFEELANFRTEYKYESHLAKFLANDKIATQRLLAEYLTFGGYPRVVLVPTLDEKLKVIDEIYQSYLERDISSLLGIKKTGAYTNLVRILAAQVGRLVNVTELSATLGLSVKTVDNYLWYLEKTFIVRRVAPYFRNLRKEVTHRPSFYFVDLGVRNYASGEFGQLGFGEKVGFVFQNFIYHLLLEVTSYRIASVNFWRSQDGAEVDFVVDWGREIVPVEVKYQDLKQPEVTRSLRSFLTKYQSRKAIVVNLGLECQEKIGPTTIFYLPFFKLNSPDSPVFPG